MRAKKPRTGDRKPSSNGCVGGCRNIFRILAVALGICCATALRADMRFNEFVAIVTDPDDPYAKIAADEFNRVCELSTGKKLPVRTGKTDSPEKCILIGKSGPENSLEHDGYRTELKNTVARISGRDAGPVYGVYALLRRFGWKYYTLDCEVIPNADAGAKDFAESRAPAFDLRQALYCFTKAELTGFPTLRMGYSPFFTKNLKLSPIVFPEAAGEPSRDQPAAYHNTSYFAPVQLCGQHPEWFARNREGNLKTASKTHYHACTTNPAYRDRCLALLGSWLRNVPEGWYVDISQGDGDDWCECPDCLALDPVRTAPGATGYGHMADRYLDFADYLARNLAREFPDVKLNMLVYCGTTEVPLKTEAAEKNLVFMFCPYPPNANCHSHDLNCPKNEKFLAEFLKWAEKFPQNGFAVFDYPVNYNNFLSALFSMDAMIAKEKFFARHRVRGFVSCGFQLMLCDLSLYLQSIVLWNPAVSAEDLKKSENEFIEAYYGPAAPGIKKFLALVREKIKDIHQGIYSGRSELSNADYVIPAYEILDQCEAAARGREPYAKRVRFEKLCAVVYTDISGMVVPNPVHRLKRLREFMDSCREFQVDPSGFPRSRIPEWLEDGFHLKMTGSPAVGWYDDPGLACLHACRTDADYEALAARLAGENEKTVLQKTTREYIELPAKAFQVRGTTGDAGQPRTPRDGNIPTPCGMVVRGGESMSAVFRYDSERPFTGGKLVLEGRNLDRGREPEISVWIDKKLIFRGKHIADNATAAAMVCPIPDNLIQKGLNTMELLNDSEAVPGANRYFITRVRIMPSNYEWNPVDQAAGSRFAAWCQAPGNAVVRYDPLKKETAISILKSGDNWSLIQLTTHADGRLAPGKRYRVTFRIRSEPPLAVPYHSLEDGPPYRLLSERVYVIHSAAAWKTGETVFIADDSNARILQINLGDQPEGARIFLKDVVLEEEKKTAR